MSRKLLRRRKENKGLSLEHNPNLSLIASSSSPSHGRSNTAITNGINKLKSIFLSCRFYIWTILTLIAMFTVKRFYGYVFSRNSLAGVDRSMTSILDRNCKVFCENSIVLELVFGGERLFNDSKSFVDRPLKVSPEDVVEAARNVDSSSPKAISDFIEQFFWAPGSDLEAGCAGYLSDFDPQHDFSVIRNDVLRTFARDLNNLWPLLCKKHSTDMQTHPERHSLLPLRHPIMIVPGGRFREFYYWDTYFIILGLLRSSMWQTSRQILENFAYVIDGLSMVPNGFRSYYRTRSQPPFFTLMVWEYIRQANDSTAVSEFMPAMEKEYHFWSQEKNQLQLGVHNLARYYDPTPYPRPESYWEDFHNAAESGLSELGSYYRSIRSAAASGWDFSTRWCWLQNQEKEGVCSRNLETTATERIIPVDLNAILYRVETILSDFWHGLGDDMMAIRYGDMARRRLNSMEALLWDSAESRYRDRFVYLDRRGSTFTNRPPFASDFFPLWFLSSALDRSRREAMIAALLKSKLIQPGGISAGLVRESTQQWDWPNVWPPLQYILIKGILGDGESRDHSQLAQRLAEIYVNANYMVYKQTGTMHEKLNCIQFGAIGGKGEYVPQTGFGWTNGVVLELLHIFPDMKYKIAS